MALPFTDKQKNTIKERLLRSAMKHALKIGIKKTSLDMLAQDAGIAKSSFYKFYESKELLFLEAGARWETDIHARVQQTLAENGHLSDKERAAAMVFSVFKTIHELGIARFLREDAPLLNELLQEKQVKAHMLSSAQLLFEALREANIRFTAPDETVSSVIQLLYLSILNFGDLGENYFPALYEIVAGACDRLVA
ncbi:MAG: TetR/AcrR family transcriptional regulator [Clostridia bacterium]|nr:TetR/AcrR family transcriptional regulator [Clostridia bacterium]